LSFALDIQAQELITGYNNETLAVLNEELRKGQVDEQVKANANDTASGYLSDKVKNSIVVDNYDLQLSGDSASPGNSMVYGTNSTGTKGWNAQSITSVTPYIGSFQIDETTASGDQNITGVGFKPSLVIFIAARSGAVPRSFGFDMNTSRQLVGVTWENNAGVATDVSIVDNQDGANQYTGKINLMHSDGFVVNWTKINAPTGTLVVKYTAFR